MSTERGSILDAIDHGTTWRLVYERSDGTTGSLLFDHRPFAWFYEGATGRSFIQDYDFGAGRASVSRRLRGVRITVDGGPFNETVYIA